MGKTIIQLLSEYGPMLSGELAGLYQKENDANNTSARKAISRARSPVQRNKRIPFANNQVFVYLESQFMKQEYCASLIDAIKNNSKVSNIMLTALARHGGFLSKSIFATLTMSPTENLLGHRKFDSLVSNMIESNIIIGFMDDYYQLNPYFFIDAGVTFNFHYSKAHEIAQKMVLDDFLDLLRKTNTISYNKGKINGEYGKFQWGFTAPSYIQGISAYDAKSSDIRPGFILSDIVICKQAEVTDVAYFIEKIKIIRAYRNLSNFIPIILVDSLDSDAFDLLKNERVIVAFINKIFGNEYLELMNDLVNVLTNATAIVMSNPKKIDQIFDGLINSEGRYNNISGDMFELLVAYLYNSTGVSYIEVSKIIPGNETKSRRPREIDVYVEKDGRIHVIECKATKSPIKGDIIREWIEKKISDIYYALTQKHSNKSIEFQFWSVGGFDDMAMTLLKEASDSTKKYSIKYFDKESMIDKAKQYGVQNFIDKVREHF